jgi:hypothetical protein
MISPCHPTITALLGFAPPPPPARSIIGSENTAVEDADSSHTTAPLSISDGPRSTSSSDRPKSNLVPFQPTILCIEEPSLVLAPTAESTPDTGNDALSAQGIVSTTKDDVVPDINAQVNARSVVAQVPLARSIIGSEKCGGQHKCG